MSAPLRAYWESGDPRRAEFAYIAPELGGPGAALLFIHPYRSGVWLEHKYLLHYTLFVDGRVAIAAEDDFEAPEAVSLYHSGAALNVFFDAVLDSPDCPDVLRDLIAQVEWF